MCDLELISYLFLWVCSYDIFCLTVEWLNLGFLKLYYSLEFLIIIYESFLPSWKCWALICFTRTCLDSVWKENKHWCVWHDKDIPFSPFFSHSNLKHIPLLNFLCLWLQVLVLVLLGPFSIFFVFCFSVFLFSWVGITK